jgi:hypothetical protein
VHAERAPANRGIIPHVIPFHFSFPGARRGQWVTGVVWRARIEYSCGNWPNLTCDVEQAAKAALLPEDLLFAGKAVFSVRHIILGQQVIPLGSSA